VRPGTIRVVTTSIDGSFMAGASLWVEEIRRRLTVASPCSIGRQRERSAV
jgi:hypothetical protein